MACTISPTCFCACGEADTTIHVDSKGSLCFFAWANYSREVKGDWFSNPLTVYPNLISDPNATQIMLDGFSCRKLVKWGGPSVANIASFLLNSAATRIIDDELPGSFNGETITRNYNLPLLTNQSLQFGLYQYASASAFGAWVDQHVWEYAIWGHYNTTIPPTARTVTLYVYDSVKALPLAGVTAQLISGQAVIDQAKTDDNGSVILNGFDTKYQVKVWATGYVPYPSIIDVDLTNLDASLQVPLQEGVPPDGDGFIIPDWIWIAIPIAVGSLGLVYILSRRRRKRRENAITVIK